jgi:hypothetical protein
MIVSAVTPQDATVNSLLQPEVRAVDPTPTPFESIIRSNYVGRAALLTDDVRLEDFAAGNFLPSAIPMPGQPFFGAGSRATLQGNGSAIRIKGTALPQSATRIEGSALFQLQDASLSTGDFDGDSNIAVREAFGRINRLSAGIMDTAFGDAAAEPETLDLAGPNARITMNDAGTGKGAGRVSYDLFSPGPEGFRGIVSLEQPLPEIATQTTTATFASFPDLVTALYYVEGDWLDFEGDNIPERFYERWHLQFASVIRDLGIEDRNGFEQTVFGWGTALSGSFRIPVNPCLQTMDRVLFSVTYGEGIAHYITDLNASPDAQDAVVNLASVLEPLPALAWYVGYTHNWTDTLRSSATYSQVRLDSIASPFARRSPYRTGDYFAINLVYHRPFMVAMPGGPRLHNFFTGFEYLVGEKETLDVAEADAQRIMWVTSINN